MRTPEEHAIAAAIIRLMNGVVYRETHEEVWQTLEHHGAPVHDHFAKIGVAVIVDDAEGYAYLRTREPGEGEEPLPRLVQRRALTYNLSLLLLLLRKRLAEFEAGGGAGKLVLERGHVVEMLSALLPATQTDAHANARVARPVPQARPL